MSVRLQLVSDLHFEFHADGGKSFIASMDPSGVDALVVAGDTNTFSGLTASLSALCERYACVLFTSGNHEAYGSSPAVVQGILDAVKKRHKNFHWLNNSTVMLKGVRISGCTLWYPPPQGHDLFFARQMNDYYLIQDFVPWVYDENKKSVEFLKREVSKADVIVTHHIPSQSCVSEEYQGSNLNHFFVYDMSEDILRGKPSYWLHGHSHVHYEAKLGDTVLARNPFGYPRERTWFKEKLVFSVEGKGKG